MAEVSGTTREAEDVGLAGQIDALLAGISDAAAGLAADQASEQIQTTLGGNGRPGRASAPGGGVGGAPAAEGDGSPAGGIASGGASGSADAPSAAAGRPLTLGQGPLRPDEVESLSTQIDSLVRDVGAAVLPGRDGAGDADLGSGADATAEGEVGDPATGQPESGDVTGATGDALAPATPTHAESASADASQDEIGALAAEQASEHTPEAPALEAPLEAPSGAQEDESGEPLGAVAQGPERAVDPESGAGASGHDAADTPVQPRVEVGSGGVPSADAGAAGVGGPVEVGEPGESGTDVGSTSSVEGESQLDLGDLDRQLAELAMEGDASPGTATSGGIPGAVLPGGAGVGLGASATSVPASRGESGVAAATVAPPSGQVAPAAPKSRVLGVVRGVATKGGARALAWIRAAASASAKAVDSAPKVVKDTIGWVGLVTVFFACCMWAVVLFFRSPKAPEVYGAASDVLEPGEPTPQPRPRPHAASEEEHGQEAGGGGGHGGGEPPSSPESGGSHGGESGGGHGGH